jgi:enoyl-CoA hydratase/carnithine racemase
MTEATSAAHAVMHEGWGELVMARPERRNALTGPMVGDLRAALAELLAGGARVILLRGEGGSFCSGLDLDAFAAEPPPAWRDGWQAAYAGLHRELYACPAVIVGALERFAINAGASLALACDLLVAGEGAYLLIGEAARGMQAPMNIAWLRLRAAEAVAVQLALAAERVGSADLHRLGLVYRVVADAEVAAAAGELAAKLAGYPGQGLASVKAGLRRPAPHDASLFATIQAPQDSGVSRLK